MRLVDKALQVFNKSILDYHEKDNVDADMLNPYSKNEIEYLFYLKNWIDTVQWHLEDIIRDPDILPKDALSIKRRIDNLNQKRTDTVEHIDDWFVKKYSTTVPLKDAKINTESPAWAIDRLSISALKIFHMNIEVNRKNATREHKSFCQEKLSILHEQQKDLCIAIEELLEDIGKGSRYMKTYRQIKMYNDEELNPTLYNRE